jgi:peptidyl-prolyl cis-trans isomerase SurA
LASAALRRVLRGAKLPSVLLAAAAILAAAASAQIAVPKYQSPIEAPQPQAPTLPAPTPISTNGSVVEYPIARVNDRIIDNSDYERAAHDLIEEAQRTSESPSELEQRQKDLLRDMIDQQLLLSRGKELDVNADAELIRRLDDIRKTNHMDSMEDLEKAVREQGLSYEDFKSNIRNSIVSQEVVRDEVGRKLTLSGKQEQAYYDAHKQEFAQPEQVRLSEILIPTPDDATDAQIAQAQAKAEQVEAKLKAGAKFEDMAKQFSGGQTADKGGDLGEFKRGALAKVLEDQTFDLKQGQFTPPIRTKQGFVVLQVTEHNAAGIPPLSAVDEQVQEAVYAEEMKPALRAYLTDLREKAFIWIEGGFVDTGATSRETKAVFVGATPPPVKKKHEQKARLDNKPTTYTPDTLAPAATPAVGAGTATAAGTATTTAGTAAVPSPATHGTANTRVSSAAKPAASTSTKALNVSASGKRKKIKREKIRYGQAPRNSLPAGTEETLTAGADQGPGATSSVLPTPGAAISAYTETASADEDPLAAKPVVEGKTRYSSRAPVEKVKTKAVKIQQKALTTPSPLTAEEKATQQLQRAPLESGPDTKKKKRAKDAPKERLQAQPPAPPKPKPAETPIPPKSVRDNGEPEVTPPANPSTLPPATAPAPGAPVDTTPSTPANPAPVPPQ